MAQKKATTKSRTNNREERLKKITKAITKDAKDNAKHIRYQSFGADKNKSKKNDEACNRGGSTGTARYCSAHLRLIYPGDILGDENKSEFCVEGRHNKQCCNNNPCELCRIDIKHNNSYFKTARVNFAEAISKDLNFNASNDANLDQYNRAMQSFLFTHIGANYPGTNEEKTVLRIKVNHQLWMEYYIKLTAFSSLLKTSAPSGYKYKDRISVGRTIKIRGNSNNNLIFFIEKDERYNDPEKESSTPVVNCVGFWNLLQAPKAGEIRNIIHLNQEQAVNVSFGFLINQHHNINKIEVELVCTRHCLAMEDTVIPLWKWPNNNDDNRSMSAMDATEHKSSASPSLSPNSTSPVSSPGYVLPTVVPPIPNGPPIPPIPIPIPQIPYQLQSNNSYQQPPINYNSHPQQVPQFAATVRPQLQLVNNNINNNYNNNNGVSLGYGGYHDAYYPQNRWNPYDQSQVSPQSTQPPPTYDYSNNNNHDNNNNGYVAQPMPFDHSDNEVFNSLPPLNDALSCITSLDNLGAASMPPFYNNNDLDSVFPMI